MKKFFTAVLSGILILGTLSCSTEDQGKIELEQADLQYNQKNKHEQKVIDIVEPALFPEGIDYDIRGDRFLISSITRGDIGQVIDGEYSVWVSNEDFVSTVGIHIDHTTKRVLITNTNLEGSLAALAAYDLSGNLLFYTVLGDLTPGIGNFVNDVTADQYGNAYVTDSYAGIIYKVNPEGEAEIFLEDSALIPAPGALSLNGIDYHPTGFLLVARIDANVIFKIPMDHPENYSEVEMAAELFSPDGLYFKNPNELLVVSNDLGGENARVQTFRTKDKWETASLEDEFLLPNEFPTTVTVKRNTPYVLSAHLDILLAGGTTDVFSILAVE